MAFTREFWAIQAGSIFLILLCLFTAPENTWAVILGWIAVTLVLAPTSHKEVRGSKASKK